MRPARVRHSVSRKLAGGPGKRRKASESSKQSIDENTSPCPSFGTFVSVLLCGAALLGFILVQLQLRRISADDERRGFAPVAPSLLRGSSWSTGHSKAWNQPPAHLPAQQDLPALSPPPLEASLPAQELQPSSLVGVPSGPSGVGSHGSHAPPSGLASAPPNTAVADATGQLGDRSCEWSVHPGFFLGEFLDGEERETGRFRARQRCEDFGEACAGITCRADDRCTPRRGTPYLATSPDSSEVSETKHCPTEAPDPNGRMEAPSLELPAAAPPLESFKLQPAGLRDTLRPSQLAVVVIAHNRPDCLEKCLGALASLEGARDHRMAVSLDDPPTYTVMESMVQKFSDRLQLEVWHKSNYAGDRPPLNFKTAVSKISEHFRFALEESFVRQGFEYAVFLENDLLAAPDFLWYFRSTAWLLEEDPSLFCVSAWNDNGFPGLVSDEKKLFRTGYFPGLGWMIRNTTWPMLREIWPRFPSTGWDHWLRHGAGLEPRECIVPEVSRTHHFDEKGTNIKAGSKLAKKLQRMLVSHLPPGQLGDLSYLLQDKYEDGLRQLLRQAEVVPIERLSALERERVYLVPYVRSDYKRVAAVLELSEAQPRTAHRGLIITRHPTSHARVILADRMRSEGLLPENELLRPHPQRLVQQAKPGESCDKFCRRSGMICREPELEFINNCAAMMTAFKCEGGCGHQVGKEIPCYVHEKNRDTALQCLVTDDAIPSCAASCSATTRLCACVPH
eukprot:TRINITY_DN35823_c0_g1_i1.p1 TRINITY_DN35823_c0_g1~~TRINITY_DN35823_c0_g1_i1.p1  ORF type:complete len:745 (+),score=122.68 TRINITY_DN35823_c0_g1_i1:34-2235(+)